MGWQDNPVVGEGAGTPAWATNPVIGASKQAVEQQPHSFGQNVRSVLQGARQGLYDIPQSVIELGARGTDAVGLSHGAYPAAHDFFTQTAEDYAPGINTGNHYAQGGRIAGEIAGTLPAGGLRIGGALAAKAPTLAKIVSGAGQGMVAGAGTSSASDAPLGEQLALGAAGGAALPAAGALLRGGKKLAVEALGQTTGAGSASIRNAFDAGLAGGEKSAAFTGSMRGDVPWSQVVNDAKDALGKLRAQRNQAYRSGMQAMSKDATVLSFEPVDEALAKTNSVKNFKGVDTSPKTAAVRAEIDKAISDWKARDPAEFHTPEGFDALKQMLGDIRDDLPFHSPQRLVADNAYNAVRQSIAKQAPAYDRVMGDYAKASDELASLQKELSLGPKGNPNTALRKLQSVMRDNANTSWGDRAKYANSLSEAGASNLMPSLAGQALSTVVPRGLAKYGDLAALLTHATSLAAAPLMSPRVVGEGAHLAGRAVGGAGNIMKNVPFQVPAFPPLNPAFGATAPMLFAR